MAHEQTHSADAAGHPRESGAQKRGFDRILQSALTMRYHHAR